MSRLAAALAVVHALGLTPLVDPEPFVAEPFVAEPFVAETYVAETYVLPCVEEATRIRVDLVFSNEGYERAAIARTVVARIGRADVRFASVEDLLVQKLVAGRPRDVEDARGVLDRHPGADAGTSVAG